MTESGKAAAWGSLLIVEDSRPFAYILRQQLAPLFASVSVCGTAAAAEAELKRSRPDLMLLDYFLPDTDASELLARLSAAGAGIPDFIVLTGCSDEKKALELLRLGARDYIVKDAGCLERVPAVIQRTMREIRTERRLSLERERSAAILESMPDAIYMAGADGSVCYANAAARRKFGEPAGRKCFEYTRGLDSACRGCVPPGLSASGACVKEFLSPVTGAYYESLSVPFAGPEGEPQALKVLRDITSRRKAEQALRESNASLEERTRSLETKNAAFRDLVAAIESEKNELRENVAANIRKVVLPAFRKLRLAGPAARQAGLLMRSLEDVASSFGRRVSSADLALSPREMEICGLIKEGMTTKEISAFLHISSQTVDKQRKNIRRKLGFTGKETNLASYLRSLQ